MLGRLLESTGKYYVPIYNLLGTSSAFTVANPKWVAAVKGNKDDVKDSKWIGDLFRLGLVPGSFIPSKSVRILREYTRHRFKLVSCKSSEKNRFQNALTVCNVALDAVVSDMFGKSASSITDYLVNSDTFDPKHCISLLCGLSKRKPTRLSNPYRVFKWPRNKRSASVSFENTWSWIILLPTSTKP